MRHSPRNYSLSYSWVRNDGDVEARPSSSGHEVFSDVSLPGLARSTVGSGPFWKALGYSASMTHSCGALQLVGLDMETR